MLSFKKATVITPFIFTGNLHYDNDLSYSFFKDFENNASGYTANLMLGNGRNGIDYVVLFENEAQKNELYFKKSRLTKMRKDDLIELWEMINDTSIEYGYNYSPLKSDLIGDLMLVTNEKYYTQHYNQSYYQDLDYDYGISGYSQGDYVKVKDISHSKVNTHESLSEIFYDSPLQCHIYIYKGEELVAEIYADEYLDNLYGTWSTERKQALLQAIDKDYQGEEFYSELMQYLEATIPNDYSGIEYTN